MLQLDIQRCRKQDAPQLVLGDNWIYNIWPEATELEAPYSKRGGISILSELAKVYVLSRKSTYRECCTHAY
jgi:hypothetical protein